MPVLNDKPIISKFQVGENVHFLEFNFLKSGIIKKIESIIDNPQNDSNGKQTNLYYIGENILPVTEEKIFATQNLLLKFLKGDYVSDLSDLSFGGSNLSGKDFSGFNLSGADLSEIDPNLGSLDVRGANLQGAVLGESFDTKEQFTTAIGYYDIDTIWTDGTSVLEE